MEMGALRTLLKDVTGGNLREVIVNSRQQKLNEQWEAKQPVSETKTNWLNLEIKKYSLNQKKSIRQTLDYTQLNKELVN